MTPSSPAPSKRLEPVGGDGAVGASRASGGGRLALGEQLIRAARGARRTGCRADRGRLGKRSKKTIDAGICSASSFTREAAGWMRSCSASKSSPPPLATTSSPSSTHRGGQLRRERLEQLGEVAVERIFVAALDEDLVAVAEHESAEAVPLGLEDPPFARRGGRRRAWRAWAATGGLTGRCTPPSYRGSMPRCCPDRRIPGARARLDFSESGCANRRAHEARRRDIAGHRTRGGPSGRRALSARGAGFVVLAGRPPGWLRSTPIRLARRNRQAARLGGRPIAPSWCEGRCR